jgi:hypothetical protein
MRPLGRCLFEQRRRAMRVPQIAQSDREIAHRSCHRLSAEAFPVDGRAELPRREMSRLGNGGLYIAAESRQDLVDALEKTLGCPMMSSVGGVLP